jgi:hypothetical protein
MWESLKRWPVLLALLVVLGALAVGLLLLPYPGGRVTRENCERIKSGTTEAEVCVILGKPLDDTRRGRQPYPCPYVCEWVGVECEMVVTFDEDGRVMDPIFHSRPDPLRSRPQRVWLRLRARLGW